MDEMTKEAAAESAVAIAVPATSATPKARPPATAAEPKEAVEAAMAAGDQAAAVLTASVVSAVLNSFLSAAMSVMETTH